MVQNRTVKLLYVTFVLPSPLFPLYPMVLYVPEILYLFFIVNDQTAYYFLFQTVLNTN